MTDVVEKLADRVTIVEKDNAILSKEFELFGGWFKESITSLRETTEEMKEGNNLLRESLNAQKIEMEYKFKELELKQENREQASEIKKLSSSEKIKMAWADPLGKVFITVGSALGLTFVGWVAIKLGVPIDQILK